MNNKFLRDLQTVFGSLWTHRRLIWRMSVREVAGRYRGSVGGMLWSFLNPLLMLTVYTFFFGVIFKARWGGNVDNQFEFATILFAGLIVFTIFSECISRAPGLVVNNVNFVKKVIFPLEILPWVAVGSALFHALISFGVLAIFLVALHGSIHWTVVFLPLILFPLMLLTVGLSWFLASLGVFVRDIIQAVGSVITVLLFLSPVFYPQSALPEGVRGFLFLNPLTLVIEQTRDVMVWGKLPDWRHLAVYWVMSVVVAWLGLAWFQRTKKGFADVL